MSNSHNPTSKASGKSKGPKCSLGVELELVALVPGDYHYTAHDAVHEALRQKVPLPCPFRCKQGSHDMFLPVDEEGPNSWEQEFDREWNTWIVDRDCSVRLTDDEKKYYPDDSVFSDIELQSRILDFFEPSPCPHRQTWPCNGSPVMWNWRDEIAAVIDTLKRGFNRPGFRVFANDTCGLHLHVGRHKMGFNLDTAKNVMGIFTALERCFDTILPVDRISGYEKDHAALPGLLTDTQFPAVGNWQPSRGMVYTTGLSVRQFEALGSDLMDAMERGDEIGFRRLVRTGASIPQWLHNMYAADSIDKLCEYMLEHQSSVNLQHLTPLFRRPGTDSKKTIEFRPHPGTLDVTEINAWIDFLCMLTIYCEKTSTTTVLDNLERNWSSPRITFVDIARLVGAAPATIDHYTDVLTTTDYAVRRFNRNIANQPHDNMRGLVHSVEQTRRNQSTIPAVTTRMVQKLVSGRYGQFPGTYLSAFLPRDLMDMTDGRFLSSEMNADQLVAWRSHVEHNTRRALQQRQRW